MMPVPEAAKTMRNRQRSLWSIVPALVLFGAGCAETGPSTTPSVVAAPSLVEAKRQVNAYVDSGRYEADIAAVADQARAYLESRVRGGGKLAIVLDVDETALSNLPSLRANDYGFIIPGPCDLPGGPCGLGAWIRMAQADAIKPVLALARLARERSVAVFFLTGRPERARAPTERNLRTAGYEWTALILKPDALTTKSAADFKAPERKKLIDQGYTIIVNIGDQMSDLEGGFAERTYKLPNPFYFLP
ncbi:MAG: acid phosphatase [Candidatus Rokuibacteriota bacterium]|nr:MAG: acid phosphatase [Candidatus Rokubacteria bacterium]PYN68918.1 MAG: acid phosphatase [Candidatus Rokubacteria bacterium]